MNLQGTGFTAVGGATSIGFVAHPKGRYVVFLTKSQLEPTEDGSGELIKFVAQIAQGPLTGQDINFNIFWSSTTANPKAVEIGRKTLQAICHAVGNLTPADTAQLHNIPFEMDIDVTPDGRYNRLVDVHPLTGSTTAPVVQQPVNTGNGAPPPPAPIDPMQVAADNGWLPNGTSGYFYNSRNPSETQLTADQLRTKFSAGNAAGAPPPPPVASADTDEVPSWIKNQQQA